MGVLLRDNMRAMFPSEGEGAKSDAIANLLIERALRGDYQGSREYGPTDTPTNMTEIIGTLYLMDADENTYTMQPDVEAYVLRMEHGPRLVDYTEYSDRDTARAYLTAKGIRQDEVTRG